ncbi:MAG: C25 family cysteine peptidase [Candidatus Delongbacteria bacterium]
MRAGGLALALLLGLTGLSRAAVRVSALPHLLQQIQPDGGLLLRLDGAADLPAEWPLVVRHQGRTLRPETPGGARLDLPVHALESAGDTRCDGLLVPRAVLEGGLLLREEGRTPERRSAGLRALAPPDPWARHAFARLEVGGEGLIRVTGAWLAEHVPGVLPDPRTWTLVHNGVPEPMLAEGCEDGSFDPDDQLIFWAEPSRPAVPELGVDTQEDPWCRREVWFLASDGTPGPRFAQETGEIIETDPERYSAPLTFPATVHVEEYNHFSRLTYVLDEPHPDHMFWTTGIYGGTLRNVTFDAPGLYPYSALPVQMRVCLRGLSAPAEEGEPDVYQRLRLYVNSTGGGALEVGADGSWRNQELRIAEFGAEAFPDHSSFVEGQNTLILAGVDEPPAGEFSSCLLNWLELTYQREYKAQGDRLLFSADPALDGRVVNFEVSGFSGEDIRVFKLGQSHFRSVIVRPLAGAWRLRFQDEFLAGTRYVAATERSLRAPDAGERVEYHGLADRVAGAGVLVVLADSLWRSGGADLLQPLLQQVASREGEVLLVSDRWVYDEFSHGKVRPHALRDLILRAWRNWSTPPGWVLLVGDGAPAPRLTTPGLEPVLPLMYEQVYKWGAASSDDWFAREENGAQLPVVVSRWPAATPEDLANLVAKEAAYRTAAPGAWNNSLLLAAGARAQDEGIFMQQTENLIRLQVPDRFFIRRILAGEQGGAYIGSRPELLALVNEGQLLVNYAGHGGGAVWEDNQLFRSEDVALLDNAQRLAFFTNATCFIASLDYQGSLGRALLNTPEVGAIGVLGSTGLGFRDTGMELVADFWTLLLGNPELAVGQALREAKQRLWLRRVPGHEGSLEEKYVHAVNVMNTILGLPWQRLALPLESQPALANPVIETGGVLQFSGSGAAPGGQGLVEVYSSAERAAQTGPNFVTDVIRVPVSAGNDGAWTAAVPLPASLPGGGATGSLRVWMPGAEGGGHSGVSWFHPADSLSGTLAWQARLLPDPPRPGLPLRAEVLVASAQLVDSVAALLSIQPPNQAATQLRLSLTPLAGDPQRWQSAGTAGPFADSTLVGLRFALYDADGPDSTTTSWYWVEDARPRLSWTLLPGTDAAGQPEAVVGNDGESESDTLTCRLVRGLDGSATAGRIPPVPRGGSRRVSLPLPVGTLGETFRVEADWDPALGGPLPDALEFALTRVAVPAESWTDVVAGGVLRIRHGESGRILAVRELPVDSLLVEQVGRRLDAGPWLLEWRDGVPGPVQGELELTTVDSLRRLDTELLEYDGATRQLLARLGGQVQLERADTLRAAFTLNSAEGFALGRLADTGAPVVQLEVDGQVFDRGGFVPPRAAFSWTLTDPGGLDARPENIQLTMDGDSISSAELALLPDPAGGRLSVRYALDGSAPRGEPLALRLFVRDAAGNGTLHESEFMVGERLALQYMGTYPNPFQRETRFVFSLSGVANGAKIEIYTVAGRLIRRLEIPGPLINYVETLWDGRDRVGDVVANGVYFYRLTAEGPEGRVEHTGKVARLK